MKRFWLTMAAAAMLCLADVKGSADDESAIRKVIEQSSAGWNRRTLVPGADATTTRDFDVVVPPGDYLKAGPEMEAAVRRDFQTIFKNARESSEIQRIRFIRPDVAIVDGRFEIAGTEIKPEPNGFQTLILVKDNGRWLITAMRRMIPVAAPIR